MKIKRILEVNLQPKVSVFNTEKNCLREEKKSCTDAIDAECFSQKDERQQVKGRKGFAIGNNFEQ